MKTNPIVGAGTPLQAWQSCPLLAQLPRIEVDRLVPPGTRAVIVAPHPDDEILGSGGLLQHLLALGRPLLLVSVTDGTASHPGSQRWPVSRLTTERPRESAEARSVALRPSEGVAPYPGGSQISGVLVFRGRGWTPKPTVTDRRLVFRATAFLRQVTLSGMGKN